jgi:hypothetical protein
MGVYATIIEALAVARDLGRITPEAYRRAVDQLEGLARFRGAMIEGDFGHRLAGAFLPVFDLPE